MPNAPLHVLVFVLTTCSGCSGLDPSFFDSMSAWIELPLPLLTPGRSLDTFRQCTAVDIDHLPLTLICSLSVHTLEYEPRFTALLEVLVPQYLSSTFLMYSNAYWFIKLWNYPYDYLFAVSCAQLALLSPHNRDNVTCCLE